MGMQTNFSASRVAELLVEGSGKTAQSYILDLALNTIGCGKDIQTKEMLHGITNQLNAYQFVISPLYPNSEWWDESIPINDNLSASPDFKVDGAPGDIKCPYYIDTFLAQVANPPKKYKVQVQCQMMACKADSGLLCFYLTKPEVWGDDVWTEYPFPLEKRYRIFEIAKDERLQDEILTKVAEAQPKKDKLVDMLRSAPTMELEKFFDMQFDGAYYRPLKEASNVFGVTTIVRVENNFYYVPR